MNPAKSDRNNGGLDVARNFLEAIKLRHDWITYADLWTLAGSAAIEALGGPTVAKLGWKSGRMDYTVAQVTANPSLVPSPGKLPSASGKQSHICLHYTTCICLCRCVMY